MNLSLADLEQNSPFHYISEYQILICRLCRHGVRPSNIASHLRSKHKNKRKGEQKWVQTAQQLEQTLKNSYTLIEPEQFNFHLSIPRYSLPFLPIHEALKCHLCPAVFRETARIRAHLHQIHPGTISNRRGRYRPASEAIKPWSNTFCQRIWVTGPSSHYFEVQLSSSAPPSEQSYQSRPQTIETTLGAEIDSLLEETEQTRQETENIIPSEAGTGQVSPWLEMTRWSRHLGGLCFNQLGLLIQSPLPAEVDLIRLGESLDRIVQAGKQSIDQDKINAFDQTRINSFIKQRRATDRPLLVKLQKGTWIRYTGTWKRLLYLVFRLTQPQYAPSYPIHRQLSYQFTPEQILKIDEIAQHLEAFLDNSDNFDQERWRVELDRLTLFLCIALLDHTLKGDLFDSVLVGFFAITAIDLKKGIFQDAVQYTPFLSGFIKIAQVLVIQRAVYEVESGADDDPADLLDIMRERFLIHSCRSPFAWALRLRAYGKQVRNSTTSLGYIHWLEDGQILEYKQTRFTLQDLQNLIKYEVHEAQEQLQDLLLITDREDEAPFLEVNQLTDDPTKTNRNWTFLQEPRNREILATGSQRWLIDRIIRTPDLRKRFVQLQSNNSIQWFPKAATAYIDQVDRFLERLALLIHLTSGQPARGSELLSLRYQNTVLGYVRGVFIDDGLVSTVTTHHKGYSITGTTKIIHRYLPSEVGELLIYYLWIIRPFVEQLQVCPYLIRLDIQY